MRPWAIILVFGLGCGGGAGPCVMESDQTFCTRNGKDCQAYSGFDNCGMSRTVSCGTCELPETCGGSGSVNVCGTPADSGLVLDGGPPPPMFVFSGTVTMNPDSVNGTPFTHAFDSFVGVPIVCRATVPSTWTHTTTPADPSNQNTESAYSGMGTTLTCSGSDAAMVATIETALSAPSTVVDVRLTYSLLGNFQVASAAVGSVDPSVSFSISASCPVPDLARDSDDFVLLAPFTCASTQLWRRFTDDGMTFTDYASTDENAATFQSTVL